MCFCYYIYSAKFDDHAKKKERERERSETLHWISFFYMADFKWISHFDYFRIVMALNRHRPCSIFTLFFYVCDSYGECVCVCTCACGTDYNTMCSEKMCKFIVIVIMIIIIAKLSFGITCTHTRINICMLLQYIWV